MRHWFVGLIIGLAILMMSGSARAAETRGNADLVHAQATAPAGVPLDGLFTMSGVDNYTKIIDAQSIPRSIAQITRNSTASWDIQAGAVWSKIGMTRMDNRLDLSQDGDLSLWLYFGNRHAAAAEGMAFVLQNQGTGYDDVAGAGESLGVWGNDRNASSTSPITFQALAKSWVLEFDTRTNVSKTNGAGQAFDLDAPVKDGMHIASGYPALSTTYRQEAGYHTLKHTMPKMVEDFADGQWHHLSLHWDAQAKAMTYAYNDRDPQTNQLRSGMDIVRDTLPVNLANLGIDKNSADAKAYWGFTGSTSNDRSNASENGLVVVDSADTLGKLDASAQLYKSATGQKIAANSQLAAGEKVTYRYVFDYDAAQSRMDIQPLTMQLALPQQLQWLSGGVSYNDEEISEPFDTKELAGTVIVKPWKRTLDKTIKRVTVTLNGVVPPVTQRTQVPEVQSRFYGPNVQKQLTLPSYFIRSDLALKLTNLGKETQQLGHNEAATITGRLTNGEKPFSAADLQQYHLVVKVGQRVLPTVDLTASQRPNEPVGTFRLKVAAKDLAVGDNSLTVVAVAKADTRVTSNPLKLDVTRAPGTLQFTDLPHDASFKATTLTGQTLRVRRDEGWQLGVLDERGTGSRWRLNVALATPFVEDVTGTPLRGKLLFSTGNTQQEIGTTEVSVVADHQTQNDAERTNVAGDWTSTSGPTLEVAGDALQGSYTGKLIWRLIDAP